MGYDAIVIGAGLSGLTAAAYLARAGATVLVCEQSGQVGGLFNSFRRGGYLFDGGIKAMESSAVLLPMLAQLGLLERVRLRPSPVALVTAGRAQPILGLADVEAYFRLLEAHFPAQQTGLRRVLADARAVYELLDAALCFPIPFFAPEGSFPEAQKAWFRQNGAALARLPRSAGLMRAELRPYLRRRLSDPGLVNLLSQLFPDGTSAFFGLGYFRMFLDYHYPAGGIQAIPNALADLVTACGGQVRLGARVEQVLVEGGQACGIRLAGGEEIRAGHVIAACDLRAALTGLTPPGVRLPSRFEARLRRAEVSHSAFHLFLGVDLPVERLALAGCQHVFYAPDLQGISEADRITRADYFSRVPLEISVPCLHQPDLAPPGKTGLIVSAMASWQYGSGWERPPAAYGALKDQCARELIASLERFIPGLAQRIELCIAATPRTIARLTGNTQGAIMGWSYRRGRGLPRGNFLQMRRAALTPVPRLLTAGHWAFAPGGSPTAALTGKVAAEHVLRNKVA